MPPTSSSQPSVTTFAASSPGSENSGACSCSSYGTRSPVQPRSIRLLNGRHDIVIHALQHLPSEQFLKRCTDQFDRLYLEGATNARIMAISIHPYITGVPHR